MISYIALCGAPQAGKTQTSKILQQYHGILPIDDGWILRDATKTLYGLTDWHVSTQEGKATEIDINGTLVPIRVLMGQLGKYLEERDPFHIPRRALNQAMRDHPGARLSFASVRMNQAEMFKATGKCLVIEVQRPGFVPQNDFDDYNRDLVDVSLLNTFDPGDPEGSYQRLAVQVQEKIAPLLR